MQQKLDTSARILRILDLLLFGIRWTLSDTFSLQVSLVHSASTKNPLTRCSNELAQKLLCSKRKTSAIIESKEPQYSTHISSISTQKNYTKKKYFGLLITQVADVEKALLALAWRISRVLSFGVRIMFVIFLIVFHEDFFANCIYSNKRLYDFEPTIME